MSRREAARDGIFRLEGGLLPADLLNQLDALQLPGQKPADYRVPKGLLLRDEIGRYWRISQALWSGFEGQRTRKDRGDHSKIAQQWLTDLLGQVFGFSDTDRCLQPQTLGDREFPITHQACSGAVPMVLCAPGDRALDTPHVRFGQAGRRRSPTGLLQEYLNASDAALWGLVSDGERLRILRDNPSMTRPAYVEIDLATLFNEERLPDFRRLWLLLHASRFEPRDRDGKLVPEACWLEQWREQAEEQGERLLDKLRLGVTEALQALGNGFLAHPRNEDLRRQLTDGELDDQTYYQELLRLVYRLLFLLRAEARELLHAPDSEAVARERYRDGYSLEMARQAARRPNRFEHRHHDLWLTLGQTFRGLESGQPLLALPALGGLFEADQCPHLDSALVDNRALLTAVRALTWHRSETNRGLVATDYANMDAEELGSVYEALLELVPAISQTPWRFRFVGLEEGDSTAGNLRKLTGSYYTPDVLVQSLINTALKPVIEQRLADNPEQPRQALLDIRVVDPACGSGHFLLAATRTLARELARLDAGDGEPTPEQYQHALREVVQHCIHGVDLNPMAVELCRAALWMEALEPGRPLTFLENRIQCGNALVGVFEPDVLEDGIPADAFKALDGDDKDLLKELRKENREQGKNIAIDLRINTAELVAVEQLPEDSLDDVQTKRLLWEDSQQSPETRRARLLQDLWTAAFFIPKNEAFRDKVVTNAALKAANRGNLSPEVAAEVRYRAEQDRFFHWQLQFAEVFNRDHAGFDVVLGNPPWERIKLQEKEFFAARAPEIAEAKNAASRGRMIRKLADSENPQQRQLYENFQEARHSAEAASSFVRNSGRFPLTGTGDVNLYALFAELGLKLIARKSRAGIIVPTGIATDDSTKAYFEALSTGGRLHSLYDFENREGIFGGVHRSYKFSLLTIADQVESADLMFFATRIEHLQDDDRHFRLTPEDFALINPNTGTCPVFRSKRDAELTRKIYSRAPVLLQDEPPRNPWNITFQAMFHMSNDSHLFQTSEALRARGADLERNRFRLGGQRFLPLYEAKMVHRFDHRFATYDAAGENTRDSRLAEKQNPNYEPLPRYWVDEWEVALRTADAPRDVINAVRKDDQEKLDAAIRLWVCGQLFLRGDSDRAAALLSRLDPASSSGGLFDSAEANQQDQTAKSLAEQHPMSDADLEKWLEWLQSRLNSEGTLKALLANQCPKYQLVWRRSARSTDERTLIASIIGWSGIGDSLFLMHTREEPLLLCCLYANLNSIVLDWVARQKVGGANFSFYYMKQLPVLPPDTYSQAVLQFISPKVEELSYTSVAMKPLAQDLGHRESPFPWSSDHRHQLCCELDACYAHLYGLTRDELRYILDPADVMGPDYPSVTFPGLKRKEMAEFDEYRTQRRVLEAFDAQEGVIKRQ